MVATRKRRRTLKTHKPTRRKRRISVNLSIEEHKRLKGIAASKGTTLQGLIIECIEESTLTPNMETIEVIRQARKGQDIIRCKDLDDFIKKLEEN